MDFSEKTPFPKDPFFRTRSKRMSQGVRLRNELPRISRKYPENNSSGFILFVLFVYVIFGRGGVCVGWSPTSGERMFGTFGPSLGHKLFVLFFFKQMAPQERLGLRGPAAILSYHTILLAIVSQNFFGLVFRVSHNYRAIRCKMGYRTDVSV